PADPAHVVQALVHTLLDVFDATRDLYNTLKNKEKRDLENSLRSRGYPDSRKIEYVDETASDEGIVLDKAAVRKQFEIGLSDVGDLFAIGDVVSQTALQSQIITLQSVIITTFLYGPTSPDPISRQLRNISDASRAAGIASVDILADQRQRQLALRPIDRSPPAARASAQHAPPYLSIPPPFSTAASSTELNRSRLESKNTAKTATVTVVERPKTKRTDTESTTFSSISSSGAKSVPQASYCRYAVDLQKDATRPLASSITDAIEPYCPHCRRILNLEPGKSWEIFKSDDGLERLYRMQNRFVVKCHRNSVDGGYCCVLCSKRGNVDTICGDVKALVRHVWMDHEVSELDAEGDIVEVVEDVRRRRDSLMSFTEARGSIERRSTSVGHGTRKSWGRPDVFDERGESVRIWCARDGR
ncbi:uncharacterized protein EI97DRAFT_383206, partial [Westerdykella ornata]